MTQSPGFSFAQPLLRPRRVGFFGRNGVGKSSLLATLFREATAGRLPGLRLTAGDDTTARYLGEAQSRLESGQQLPATPTTRQLRFTLWHEEKQIELMTLDYSGEELALGGSPVLRDFFSTCDVLFVCLDLTQQENLLAAEREIQQLLEASPADPAHPESQRPVALLHLKSDLAAAPLPVDAPGATEPPFQLSASDHATFAVSSFYLDNAGRPILQPQGLAEPLLWLVSVLHRMDAALLAQLFRISDDVSLKRRALAAFRKAYPADPLGPELAPEVRPEGRFGRRLGFAAAIVAFLVAAVAIYDAVGAARMRAVDAHLQDDPLAARDAWRQYQQWHPTRHLFATADPSRARAVEYAAELATLQLRGDLDDLHVLEAELNRLAAQYADVEPPPQAIALKQQLNQRREQAGQREWAQLERTEADGDWAALAAQATQLSQTYADLPVGQRFAEKHRLYQHRWDEAAFQAAVEFSQRSQTNYLTQRELYQAYLDQHPQGRYVSQAKAALQRINTQWDRADYHQVRERFQADPGTLDELRTQARAYLATHPQGAYRDPVTALLRWCDQVSEPGEYTVTLVSGVFDKKAAFWASRGVSVAVTLEVGGIVYGPSTVIKNNYIPQWNYTFPRKIRWKHGDRVRILVKDQYLWNRTLAEITWDDPLAMRHLSGLVDFKNGSVRFESDFPMPQLPRADE
jgi:GTPase SAR1 family protein